MKEEVWTPYYEKIVKFTEVSSFLELLTPIMSYCEEVGLNSTLNLDNVVFLDWEEITGEGIYPRSLFKSHYRNARLIIEVKDFGKEKGCFGRVFVKDFRIHERGLVSFRETERWLISFIDGIYEAIDPSIPEILGFGR
jgi:hypothetical protein